MPKKRFEILVANDDGIMSQGIQTLSRALTRIGNVTVVAPEREQSTMGHALTLHKPVRLHHYHSEPRLDQWSLSGTPADCVYMGLRKVMKKRPDIIVSGINRGVNVGNDIYYSGTIAAAREGAVIDIPAIAASLDFHYEPGMETPFFEPAAEYVTDLALEVLEKGLPRGTLLNVNFPSLPWSRIKGVRVTRQGFRMYTDVIKTSKDNRGRPYYWLGGVYAGFKPIKDSDCEVLDRGYISITPCRIDVTHYEIMNELAEWRMVQKLPKSVKINKTKRGKAK